MVATQVSQTPERLRLVTEEFQPTTYIPADIYSSQVQAPTEEEMGEFKKGLYRGIDETQALLGGALGLAGDAIGSDTIRDFGYDIYKEQMAEAEQYAPAVESMFDIDSMDSFLDWIAGTAGSVVPSVAGAALTGGAGGLIGGQIGKRVLAKTLSKQLKTTLRQKAAQGFKGRQILEETLKEFGETTIGKQVSGGLKAQLTRNLARKAAKRGAQAGVVGFSSAVESGGNWIDDWETNPGNTNPMADLAFGVASGMTDLIGGEGMLISKLFGKQAGKKLVAEAGEAGAKQLDRGFFNTMVREVSKSMAAEGGQEALQESLGVANAYFNTHSIDAVMTMDVMKQLLEAGAAGAVGGAMFGAPSGLKTHFDTKAYARQVEEAALAEEEQKLRTQALEKEQKQLSELQAYDNQINDITQQYTALQAGTASTPMEMSVPGRLARLAQLDSDKKRLQKDRESAAETLNKTQMESNAEMEAFRTKVALGVQKSAEVDRQKNAAYDIIENADRGVRQNLNASLEALYRKGAPTERIESFKQVWNELDATTAKTIENIARMPAYEIFHAEPYAHEQLSKLSKLADKANKLAEWAPTESAEQLEARVTATQRANKKAQTEMQAADIAERAQAVKQRQLNKEFSNVTRAAENLAASTMAADPFTTMGRPHPSLRSDVRSGVTARGTELSSDPNFRGQYEGEYDVSNPNAGIFTETPTQREFTEAAQVPRQRDLSAYTKDPKFNDRPLKPTEEQLAKSLAQITKDKSLMKAKTMKDLVKHLAKKISGKNGPYTREEARILLQALLPNALNLKPHEGARWLRDNLFVTQYMVDPEALRQDGSFYSPVQRAVEGINVRALTPEAWKQQILATQKKGSGVKQEEIDDLGLFDWLDGLHGKVRKETILEFVEKNGPQLEEVRYGDIPVTDALLDEMAQEQYGEPYASLQEHEQEYLLEDAFGDSTQRSTRYEEYVLPGGKNYREVLITVPNPTASDFRQQAIDFVTNEPGRWSYRDLSADTRQDVNRIAAEMAAEAGGGQAPYTSSHWDEANVLAHFRLNDRTDADGNKVLFIEEIQSDWHQAGRKEGYHLPPSEGLTINDLEFIEVSLEELVSDEARLLLRSPYRQSDINQRIIPYRKNNNIPLDAPVVGYRLKGTDDSYSWDASGQSKQAIFEDAIDYTRNQHPTYDSSVEAEQRRRLNPEQGARVPHAPFKKTETWAMLAFKSILKRAAEQGYDYVAWAPGHVQNSRYKLSHQIRTLVYVPKWQELIYFDHDGNTGRNGIKVESEQDLAQYVGKDVAQKLLAQPLDESGAQRLEGLDLEIAPTDLRPFYDKVLPKAVKKYIKKLDKSAEVGQHHVEITPAIRGEVLEGQPLYQQAQDITKPRGAYVRKHGKIIISMLKAADKSTFLHETAHAYLDNLVERVNNGWATKRDLEDLSHVKEWLGFDEKKGYFTRKQHEKFARGFEKYLMTAKAPNSALARFFEMVKKWLKDIYKTAEALNVDLSPAAMRVYRNMILPEKKRAVRAKSQKAGKVKEGVRRKQSAAEALDASKKVVEDFGTVALRAMDKKGKSFLTEGNQLDYTWWDKLKTQLQDYYHPIRMVLEAVKEKKGSQAIDADTNVWAIEEAIPNRIVNLLQKFDTQYITPLKDQLAEFATRHNMTAKQTQEQVDLYLLAKHAPERNAQLRRRTDGGQEAGSGITDQMSADLLAGKPVKIDGKVRQLKSIPQLKQIGETVQKMGRYQLGLIKRKNLLPAEIVKQLEETYKYYVPLKGWDEAMEMYDPGYKNRVRGAKLKLKEAMGRGTLPDSPMINMIMQSMDIMNMYVRVDAGRSLLALARKHKDLQGQDFFFTEGTSDKKAFKWKKGKGSSIELQKESVPFSGDPRAITVIDESGNPVRLLAPTQEVADAFTGNNLYVAGPILKFFGKITRNIAKMATTWNPAFVVANPVRDLFTASLNILDEKHLSKKYRINNMPVKRQLYANWNSARKYILAAAKDPVNYKGIPSKWKADLQEFYSYGGFSEQFGLNDQESVANYIVKGVERVRNKGNHAHLPGHVLRKMGDFIEMQGNSLENAVRFSTYVTLRDAWIKAGMPAKEAKLRAASSSRNITVNFSKRGALAPLLGPLYMFSNASIQGTARMFRTMARNPKLMAAVLTSATAGVVVMAQLGRFMGGEDEDGTAYYDKIPAWVKNTNLVFMLPGTEGKYFKLPLPYGYNVFNVIGQMIDQTYAGRKSVPEAAAEIVNSLFDNFSPVGSPEAGWTTLIPTFMRPPLQLEANKGFFGQKIMPDVPSWVKYDVPDATRYWSTVSPWALTMANALNWVGGTTDTQKGVIDISPESIEHLVESYLGGVGKTISRTLTVVDSIFDTAIGNTPKKDMSEVLFELPVIRRGIGATNFYSTLHEFNEVRSDVAALNAEATNLRKTDRMGYRDFIKKNPTYRRSSAIMLAADKRLRKFRKLKNSIMKSKNAGTETARLQKIENMERKIIQQALKQINMLKKDK